MFTSSFPPFISRAPKTAQGLTRVNKRIPNVHPTSGDAFFSRMQSMNLPTVPTVLSADGGVILSQKQLKRLNNLKKLSSLPNAASMSSEIKQALLELADVEYMKGLEEYARSMGINLLYRSGQEMFDDLIQKKIIVTYGDMMGLASHAQWRANENTILINQKYRQSHPSKHLVYAISEAMMHEAGHTGRLGDGYSSLQEELDTLLLNAWGHYYHQQQDMTYANSATKSELLQDGVAVYADLFFNDPDPYKTKLVQRLALKYAPILPVSTRDHPVRPAETIFVPNNLNPGWWMHLPSLADRIVRYYHDILIYHWMEKTQQQQAQSVQHFLKFPSDTEVGGHPA